MTLLKSQANVDVARLSDTRKSLRVSYSPTHQDAQNYHDRDALEVLREGYLAKGRSRRDDKPLDKRVRDVMVKLLYTEGTELQ